MMKIYYIIVRNKMTGLEVHRSDGFDNADDAKRWAKDLDCISEEYWVLEWTE